MKTSTQLKALVRNMSRKLNVEAEIILRNFMLERLLERISLSKHRQSFILKGGMLISAMVGIDARTTIDHGYMVSSSQMKLSLTKYDLNHIYTGSCPWYTHDNDPVNVIGKNFRCFCGISADEQ